MGAPIRAFSEAEKTMDMPDFGAMSREEKMNFLQFALDSVTDDMGCAILASVSLSGQRSQNGVIISHVAAQDILIHAHNMLSAVVFVTKKYWVVAPEEYDRLNATLEIALQAIQSLTGMAFSVCPCNPQGAPSSTLN